MHRVELLLNFSREFFMEHTIETINENVLLAIKIETESILGECTREFDDFCASVYTPASSRRRYQRINADLKAYVDAFKNAVLVNHKQQKRRHLDSSSVEEDDTFCSANANFDSLRVLLLELEIQNQHWRTLNASPQVGTPPGSTVLGPTVELKRPFFEELFAHYAKANKLLGYAALDADGGALRPETVAGAKAALEEFNKDEFLKHTFHRVRDSRKILKILGGIFRVCGVLFGDKIFLHGEGVVAERKESGLSDYLLSVNNRQASSFKLSLGLSKIRSKRGSKGPESLLDDFNLLWEDGSKPDKERPPEPRTDAHTPSKPPPRPSTPARGPDDFHSRCYCTLF